MAKSTQLPLFNADDMPLVSFQNYANLRGQKNIKSLDKLFLDIDKYRDSQEYLKLLKFISKFSEYAPYNGFLLYTQNPEISFVATTSQWKSKFGRTIKIGSRPLVILRPFGPVEFVFDMQDTEGDPNQVDQLTAFLATVGNIDKGNFDRLLENCRYEDIFVTSKPGGLLKAGEARRLSLQEKDFYKTNSVFGIYLNDSLSLEQKFATLVHEIAHIFCGHLNSYKPD